MIMKFGDDDGDDDDGDNDHDSAAWITVSSAVPWKGLGVVMVTCYHTIILIGKW